MKINILDAGLIERSGHHYDFDAKLMRYYAGAGHEVRLYGFAGLADDVVEELWAFGPVAKHFRTFQYGAVGSSDFYAGELDAFLRKTASMTEDLSRVEPADLWVWPSFRPHNLYASAMSGTKAMVVGCLHRDNGIEARSVGAMLWRASFLAAARARLRYTVGSIEPELCHRFAPLVPGGRVVRLPQPFDGPPIEQPKPALKRIGFVGQQRAEKGRELLSTLFERLIADGYSITFQNSNPRYDVAAPQVEMLGFVEDVADPIRKCDLIVLPYNASQYAEKGSGILAQCLALGVPTTGPAGTLPGRLIEQHAIGPLFGTTTSDAIYAAIKSADRNYAAISANAFAVAQQFAKQNGVGPFAEAFLACVGPTEA